MKKIALFCILFSSGNVLAETKQLICTVSAKSEMERLLSLKANGNPIPEEIISKCQTAEFGLRSIFTFDTSILRSSEKANVEVIRAHSCGEAVNEFTGTVSSSPTAITFDYMGIPKQEFIVDRKTLKGGNKYPGDLNYTCILRDIDTSKNLI